MGEVGGLFGTGGGASGTGYAAPSFGGNSPTNPLGGNEISTAYGGNQNALQSQQQLLQALQAQNGIQNQSNVYNQLQGVVNGTGPNPAQAMLNQSTGQNVANQAALMAAQRGAGANVGLLARQAAMQGANIQQQAVGQGATMQANQSLNALGQAGTLAGNQVANQVGQVNANTQAQQSEQSNLLNALAGYNATNAGLQSNINSSNASLANTTMNGQQSLIGGTANSLLGGGSQMFKAQGGEIQHFDDGGMAGGPQSIFAQSLARPVQVQSMPQYGGSPEGQAPGPGAQALRQSISEIGKPKTPPIPGGTQTVAGGGDSLVGGGGSAIEGIAPLLAVAAQGGEAHDYRGGGGVRAKSSNERAVVHGNDYANDKIPAVLSEGEVVIPRSVMQSKDPSGAAAKFVAAVMQKKKMKG